MEVGGLRKVATATFLIATLLLQGGCPYIWYFSVTGLDEDGIPFICVSEGRHCTGDAIIEHDFVVFEVRPTGYHKVAWFIERNGGEDLYRFKYGQVPDGWTEVVAPEPLQPGVVYRVGPVNWFRLHGKGEETSYEVGSGEHPGDVRSEGKCC